MRRIAVISYTETGRQLNDRLLGHLRSAGDVAFSFTQKQLRQEWDRTSAFVFIGAMGIAVRQIAPLLRDKTKDPAVIVLDETAQFVIPVLSGHIGGGVAIARQVAEFLGAQAVITTATDVEGRFAVDVFARRNHMLIQDLASAKEVSAAILRGETVDVFTRARVSGDIPPGLKLCEDFDGGNMENNMCFQCAAGQTCVLIPQHYILGVGCKKGKNADELEGMLRQICEQYRIDVRQIAGIASIDVKREEAGIWELSRRLGIPYEVFSAGELEQIEEAVEASEFVRQTVGVDNVCERSALCLAGRWCGGVGQDMDILGMRRLVVRKQARDGMTMAVAQFVQKEYRW